MSFPATSPPPSPPASDTRDSQTQRFGGVVNGGVFVATLALGGLVYFTPMKAWLLDGEVIKQQLQLFGVAAPLAFTAAAALLTAIGLPRLLLCSLAGFVFGFAWGLVWAQMGSLLGSYATFLFARSRGREYALRRFPRLQGFSHSLESRGLMAVLVLRQLPVSGFYNSVLLGLTAVSHRDFLLGSFFGFLPLGVTASLLGAGLIQGDALKGAQYLIVALACSIILGVGLNRLVQIRNPSKEAA